MVDENNYEIWNYLRASSSIFSITAESDLIRSEIFVEWKRICYVWQDEKKI